ncbi:MAG: ATP-binding protein, partial [Clostridia bacterium]|nr:ATP-binding protein [Clostridia bacterium]
MAVRLEKQNFEEKFPEIAQTELWKIFRKKANKEGYSAEFVSAVSRICELGLEKSKTIMTFFPTFTLHDNTHIRNVCDWMFWLLGGRKENGKVKKGKAKELTTREAAMLLMSACCHDIGMSVDKDQHKQLKVYNDKWQKYFEKNVEDQLRYNKAKAEKEKKEADNKTDDKNEIELITEEMLRNYVRSYHHERIAEIISPDKWGRDLTDNGLYLSDLITLCKSHGESLNSLRIDAPLSFDMRLCAVLLRLADILDFDPTRAPDSLFRHMKLDEPTNKETSISSCEFKKNAVGKFIVSGNNITYSASMDDPRLRKEVEGYIDWVNYELTSCRQYIKTYNTNWKDLSLPENIIPRIDMNYCESGEFMITMEQDNIINLLKGEDLYSDKYVFVRELLQNAIDAVLWRGRIDYNFDSKTDGKIKITTWIDKDNGQGWFRIEDNGTGMNVEIIKKYFLTIGRSYYQSDDFKRDGNGKPEYNPISRFGIGILSCFLTDENNTLEVSTKRAGSPAVRLSVTGLKGLYRLAAEGSTIGKDEWQKMPKKSGENDLIYRSEPGTTICVGLNLLYLEGYNSIKDVVDKYVQFPDMLVEYDGAEGKKTYTTKGELLTAINNLKEEERKNDRPVFPIVRKYDIPPKYVDKLKEWNPAFDRENNCPKIIIEYFPLDLFSEENKTNPNLSGIGIRYETEEKNGNLKVTEEEEGKQKDTIIKYSVHTHIMIDTNNKQINMRWFCSFNSIDENYIKNRPDNSELKRKYETLRNGKKISITFDELKLSDNEQNILVYTSNNSLVAYNGVLAQHLLTFYRHFVILFGNEYMPAVNVSRDRITNVPFKAAVETDI